MVVAQTTCEDLRTGSADSLRPVRQVEETPKPEKALVDVMVAGQGMKVGQQPAAVDL